ncbi:TonB family protein [Sphingopyxis panaciterrae]|uniref:energy transducer TonB n=1 Tax=Sphingopyxis panaciterrae TaxID=363841 RepID=UPI001FB8A947|nr:energy transducer TonB [Sphingopyxis panaciterrae]NIJ39253.1 TonB family protein [Sphingopyxis panaciterrae]
MREYQGERLNQTVSLQGQNIDDLERITKLWQEGALTDAEFATQKTRLLGSTQQSVTASPDPDWNDAQKPKRNSVAVYGAWTLIVAAAGGSGILAYDYIGNNTKIVEAIADTRPEIAADNLLEQALRLGVAKRADYTKLLENGGLDRGETWHGLQLTEVQVEYLPSGKAKSFFATTPRLTSTIADIRRAINGVCGLKDGDWVKSDMPGYISATATNAKCDALYLPANEERWAITLNLPDTVKSPRHPEEQSEPTSNGRDTAQTSNGVTNESEDASKEAIRNEGAEVADPNVDLSSPARLIGSPQQWITYDDYPVRAMREQREGTADFRLAFNERGSVVACEVTSSSGHADLDTATCSIARRRARFNPGQDRTGNPTGGTYSNRIRWQIPR